MTSSAYDVVRHHGVASRELHHADACRPLDSQQASPRGLEREIAEHGSKDAWVFRTLDRSYTSILRWSLSHRAIIAGIALLVLASSVPLFIVADKNFLPSDDQSEFEVGLRAGEGTSLEATEIIANRIASRIQALDGVSYTLVSVADDPARTQNVGTVYVRLKPVDERARDQFELMNIVREKILPSVGVLAHRRSARATIGGGGNQNAEIQFTISGPDLKRLEQYAGAVVDAARKEPGVVDLDTSLNVGKPELSVQLDRLKAADLGVQTSDAAEALRLLVGGDQVSTYNEGGEQYEVHVRALEGDRQSAEAIGQLTVPSDRLGSVPLDNLAQLTRGTAPSEINRLNRQRQVTVFAGLLQAIRRSGYGRDDAHSRGVEHGPGYTTRFAGVRRARTSR
jgi:HAE1 family hydrophobic/amphiphilic exporter-1